MNDAIESGTWWLREKKHVGNVGQGCNSSLVIVLIQCHRVRISQACFWIHTM